MSNAPSHNSESRDERRVVITGMGLISPLGNSPTDLWQAIVDGRSGVAKMASIPADRFVTPYAAEARDFTGHIDNFGPLEPELKKTIRKGLKLMCREIEMGVASAQRALSDAGYKSEEHESERTGVSFGSDYIMTPPQEFADAVKACHGPEGKFEFDRWAPIGMPKIAPLWLLKYLPNMPASHIAIYNDFRGPSNSITQREASSNLAIGEAYATILRGHADTMIAGATGTRVHCVRSVHVTLQEQIAEGSDPEKLARPFDRNRNGMVLGEGAAAIVLEELGHAKRRGAVIRAEILGHASSAAVSRFNIGDCRTAIRNAITQALRVSHLAPRDVGYIHAHGLSTTKIDAEEAAAIHDVFGDRVEGIPVTAAKSYFGNLGAGSGGVELIANVMGVQHGKLFATRNYETPDPACPVHVVRETRSLPGNCFIGINVTPLGQASALVVRRYDG